MPASRAILRKQRCRAKSKRSGKQCRRYVSPGHVVCHFHGLNGHARAAAEAREIIAELASADPRPLRTVLRDAARFADTAMRDASLRVQAGDNSADALAELVLASGRAAQLAKVALDNGAEDAPGDGAEARGERIAEVLRVVATELVSAAGGTGQDQVAVRGWISRAVPAALRGEVLPSCPRPWRSTDLLPALESGAVFRQRESERVSAAVSVREPSRVKVVADGGNGTHSGVHQPRTGGSGGVGRGVPSWAPVGVRDAVASSGSSLLRKGSDHA